MSSLKVVIADDSVLLREGLARLLEESGFEVAGQAGDAEDLLRKVGAHKPDVAVVDVRMPPTHTDEGLRAAHRIRAEHPKTGVLVLSQYVDEAYALDLLSESTESTGYLLKDRVADVDTFTDAVRRVASGGSALDPEVVAERGDQRRSQPQAGARDGDDPAPTGRAQHVAGEALLAQRRQAFQAHERVIEVRRGEDDEVHGQANRSASFTRPGYPRSPRPRARPWGRSRAQGSSRGRDRSRCGPGRR